MLVHRCPRLIDAPPPPSGWHWTYGFQRCPRHSPFLFYRPNPQSIKAKLNRSILKRSKEAVPFLKDRSYGVSRTVEASMPSPASSAASETTAGGNGGMKPLGDGTNGDAGQNERDERALEDAEDALARFPNAFPAAEVRNFRPAEPLITNSALVSLKAHTNALTRGARLHKMAKQRRMKDALVKMHDDAGLPISELKRMRFNLQVSVTDALCDFSLPPLFL